MIQVAVTIEDRAVLASVTVRNWLKMGGSPAVPSTRDILSEITSSTAMSPAGGGGTTISEPICDSTSLKRLTGLKPMLGWASTKRDRVRVPAMRRTALTIWIQVVATMPPATM